MMNELVRKCRYCDTPLPEKSRANREFCPQKFGVIDYCKNKVNNPKASRKYHLNKELMKINSVNWGILKNMLGTLPELEVTLQQLSNVGFKMTHAINHAEMNASKNPVLLFIEFGIEKISENLYKIFRHGRQF